MNIYSSIGRVTKNFLSKINSDVVVDIVEPVKKFTDEIAKPENFAEEKAAGKIGKIVNVGLEAWTPEEKAYWVIWKRVSSPPPFPEIMGVTRMLISKANSQWCVGHLTDVALTEYLKRCVAGIKEGGMIVVKENISNCSDDVYDEVDSSVTRYIHRSLARVSSILTPAGPTTSFERSLETQD